MAVTSTDLVTRYPEFTDAVTSYSGMVNACLEQAREMVGVLYFGTKADHAVLALAAHFIAINPLGEMARIQKEGRTTVYWQQYEMLRASVGTGFRVI